ncbi:MAG: hypothetical protein KKA05_10570 [Alphaproteobacteria bacterium]|nr:hypothetical protein [Alphaproteobacteria bacterium]
MADLMLFVAGIGDRQKKALAAFEHKADAQAWCDAENAHYGNPPEDHYYRRVFDEKLALEPAPRNHG